MPSRIAELAMPGHLEAVFGRLDTDSDALAPTYRSRGSATGSKVPKLVHNASGAPPASYFEVNVGLARWRFPAMKNKIM